MLFFKLNILPLKTLEKNVWSYAGKNLDTVGHLIKEVRKRDAVSMNVERQGSRTLYEGSWNRTEG